MPDCYITVDTLFDARTDVREPAAVLVRGGHIVYAGPRNGAPPVGDATVYDYPGATLLPGLINAHGHLTFSGGDDPVADMLADDDHRLMVRAVQNARAALRAGVTTVRDLGDRAGVALALRQAIDDGLIDGPRLLVAGAPITTTGGHCYFMGAEADGIDALRRTVRSKVKAGVDLIKIMATGGGLTPGTNMAAPQFSVEELAAVVEDAHRLNRRVAAHAHGTPGIQNAALAGVDTIEHCSWRVSAVAFGYDEDTAKAVLSRGIFVCFTLAAGYHRVMSGDPNDPVTAKRRSDREQRAVIQRRFVEAGAKVIAGSDAGVTLTPFADFVTELELLVGTLGLTPLQAIEAATLTAAQSLGIEDRAGTLEPGKDADLLIVPGDPRRDIAALRQVIAVYRNGRLVA